MTVRKALVSGLTAILLAGCAGPMPMDRFAGSGPAFDPLRFWTGHVRSWGVLENRSAEPDDIVTTDCVGELEAPDRLHMTQLLTLGDGSVRSRDWHMRRIAPGRYQATASDMVGTASGTASGRAFHWSWVLATRPGNRLFDVTLDQWMYLMPNGTMLNRTSIRRLGITLAEVTEQFEPVP